MGGYGVDPEATELVDRYDWYFLPLINADGYVYTWTEDRLWRKSRKPSPGTGCVGTDLNRNFDFQWESKWPDGVRVGKVGIGGGRRWWGWVGMVVTSVIIGSLSLCGHRPQQE